VDRLRNEPEWPGIEQAAVEYMTKGSASEQPIDQY
jgi:hypothetical protein